MLSGNVTSRGKGGREGGKEGGKEGYISSLEVLLKPTVEAMPDLDGGPVSPSVDKYRGREGGREGGRRRSYLEVLLKPTVEAVFDLERGPVCQDCLSAGVHSPPNHVRGL